MNRTGLTYRTPADVRAIPHLQWEAWLRAEAVPFRAFAATAHVQEVLRTILDATQNRMGARKA